AFGTTATTNNTGGFGTQAAGGGFGGREEGAFGSGTPFSNTSSNSTDSKPNFDAPHLRKLFRPGKTPYDSQLPPNYLESVLPKAVVEVFKRDRFDWGEGGVPEWIPPVELR
ncbi:hypothetical protein EV368DRAFT_40446, partial [Lentinula lateritia]